MGKEKVFAVPTNIVFENINSKKKFISNSEMLRKYATTINKGFLTKGVFETPRRSNANSNRVVFSNDLIYFLNAGKFHDRESVEKNPDFKQIIPYISITNKDNEIYITKRTENQTEKRLHNLYSIGLGGHINPEDSENTTSPLEILLNALRRELREEVELDYSKVLKLFFSGIINDNSNSVGQVHLGFAFELRIVGKDVSIKEKDNMTGEWISKERLFTEYYPNLETWSSIFTDYYTKIL